MSKKNKSVSEENRQQHIKRVMSEHFKVIDSAKSLGIEYDNSKKIIQKYVRENPTKEEVKAYIERHKKTKKIRHEVEQVKIERILRSTRRLSNRIVQQEQQNREDQEEVVEDQEFINDQKDQEQTIMSEKYWYYLQFANYLV